MLLVGYDEWKSGCEEDSVFPVCSVCYVCGSEAEEFYLNRGSEVVGCSECLNRVWFWEMEDVWVRGAGGFGRFFR